VRLSTSILIGVLIAGAYILYQQNQKIAQLEATLTGGQDKPLATATLDLQEGDPPPASGTKASQRITCPACRGEGRLMMRADGETSSRSGNDGRRVTRMGGGGSDKPYPCPVCGSVGYRQVPPLPAGFVTCPDCLGMRLRAYSQHELGYVEFNVCQNRGERLVGRPCMRCGATGQVKGEGAL